MDQARMDRAMSRIEAALARIERSARPGAAASADGGSGDATLRRRVEPVLSQLDALIAELER
jgi:hypothetical protein